MTFKILNTLPENLQERLTAYLNEHVLAQCRPDVSNYAKGRQRAWFPYEAPLSAKQPWRPGIEARRLWNYLTYLLPMYNFVPEVALVSKGAGITRHRDASYAQYRAIGLNLGRCTWHYELVYPEFKWSKSEPGTIVTPESYELTGGELFEFNCKNPHWITDVDPERWGINVWRISPKERERFDALN